jgi:beta-glucanase (GH16 family)
MPFKDTFNAFKAQLKDLQAEGQKMLNSQSSGSHGGSQYNAPPPGQHAQYPGPHNQPQFQAAVAPPPHNNGGGQPSAVYWSANFDTNTPVNTEWEQKLGNNNGWGNNELQHYTNEAGNSFYMPNRLLVLRAIATPNHPDPARKYTSARLVSHQRLSRPRGSLVATLTLPCASGIWPAFWLLPFEPFAWPHEGEVDIAETWNGDGVNHSCLHWGFYTPQENWKHRVIGTPIPGMQQGRPVRFEFAWDQDERTNQGRLLWWIDGRPVMKSDIPQGTRPMKDFVVLLNIAMGGNVTQGQTPREGSYDFVVHDLRMLDSPENGSWARFEADFRATRNGDTL